MKILTYLALTVMLCAVLPVSALAEEVTEPTSTETPVAEEPVEVITETTDQQRFSLLRLAGLTRSVRLWLILPSC